MMSVMESIRTPMVVAYRRNNFVGPHDIVSLSVQLTGSGGGFCSEGFVLLTSYVTTHYDPS